MQAKQIRIARPERADDSATGALIDIETGDVLTFGQWQREAPSGPRRAWVMRWQSGRTQRGESAVRWAWFVVGDERPTCSCGKRLGERDLAVVGHGPECCTCPTGSRVHEPNCLAAARVLDVRREPRCMGTDQRSEDIARFGTNGAERHECGAVATYVVDTTMMGRWRVCDRHIAQACKFGGVSTVTVLDAEIEAAR